MECIHAGCGRLCRGAGAVGSLVNIFAINIDGVGHKGGTTVAATGVALLKAEELQLGLDTLKKTLAHVCGVGERWKFVVGCRGLRSEDCCYSVVSWSSYHVGVRKRRSNSDDMRILPCLYVCRDKIRGRIKYRIR